MYIRIYRWRLCLLLGVILLAVVSFNSNASAHPVDSNHTATTSHHQQSPTQLQTSLSHQRSGSSVGFEHSTQASILWVTVNTAGSSLSLVGNPKLQIDNLCMNNTTQQSLTPSRGDVARNWLYKVERDVNPKDGIDDVTGVERYPSIQIDTTVEIGDHNVKKECTSSLRDDNPMVTLSTSHLSSGSPSTPPCRAIGAGLVECPIKIVASLNSTQTGALPWNIEVFNELSFEVIGGVDAHWSVDTDSVEPGMNLSCAGTGIRYCDRAIQLAAPCGVDSVRAKVTIRDIDLWAIGDSDFAYVQPHPITIKILKAPRDDPSNLTQDRSITVDHNTTAQSNLVEAYKGKGTGSEDNKLVLSFELDPEFVYEVRVEGIYYNNRLNIHSNESANPLKCDEPPTPNASISCSIDLENMLLQISGEITYIPPPIAPSIVGVRLAIEDATLGGIYFHTTSASHSGNGIFRLNEQISFSSIPGVDPSATSQSFRISMQPEGIDEYGNATGEYHAVGASTACQEEKPELPCSDPNSPLHPCPTPPPPPTCADPSQRIYPSKGTQLEGRSYPILSKFAPIGGDDPVRLYKYDWNVQGPSGSGSGQVRALKGGVGTYEITANASRGFHDYKWEYDWDYDWTTEQAWQQAWDAWQSAHSIWEPYYPGWDAAGPPSPVSAPSGGPTSPHGHNAPFSWPAGPWGGSGDITESHGHWHWVDDYEESCTTDDDGDESCEWVKVGRHQESYGHGNYPSTLAAYWSYYHAEPTPAGGYPMKTGKLGFTYSPSYGRYAWAAAGKKFGNPGQFQSHPDSGVDVDCSQQLVMIPPQCQSVSGLIANVGETKGTTTATYLNPNPVPRDMNLQALGTWFEINAGNYHTSESGTGTSGGIPAGGTKKFYGSATKHNLPGNYDADWDLNWDIHWGDSPGVWGRVIDYVGGEPAVHCAINISPIQIFAAPPTCRVILWEWEVERSSTPHSDSLIRIEVELTNPNLVPIAVNAAGYTISSVGSGGASNLSSPPGPSVYPHNPISSHTTYPPAPEPQYISAGGMVRLVSQKHPYPVPGQYNYNWNGLDVFLGVERWNTSGGPNNHPSAYAEPIGPCRETLRLAYLPYIKVYEGDVAVGGRFGTGDGIDACSSGNTIIGTRSDPVADGITYGFSKHTGQRSFGASVEYALRAFSSVHGYYSASQRQAVTTPPGPHTGLTLANTGSDLGTHGGDYGKPTVPPPTTPPTPPPNQDSFANRRCIANYWAVIINQQETATISGGSLDLADDSLVPENSRIKHVGDLTITASSQLEINSAIYVEGDIFINSDIVNNQVKVWQQDRRKVGSLYLIAKGNVYINRNVGQVDAIIVAIPPGTDPAEKGIVYTCTISRTTHLGANHHQLCSKQLIVNGAVIARNIVLGRTHGSRNLGSPFEHPTGIPTGTSNVAEIFYFSPEYYVSLPIASSAESQIDREEYYRSDSIISLPPLF